MKNAAAILRNLNGRRELWARVVKSGLTAASGMYGAALVLHRACDFRRKCRLPAPVVSVGNITTGGTGKTPAVAWLARTLRQISDFTPIILSRGYGEDEIRLLEELEPNVPHVTGKNRFRSGVKAIDAYGMHVAFLLDDGFQHRRLERDLDIVLIDAIDPFGMGHLLPRGLLREPQAHLSRADLIILTRCDLVLNTEPLWQHIRNLCRNAVEAEAVHAPVRVREIGKNSSCLPASLSGKPLFLFAGIGNPGAFSRTVSLLGAKLTGERHFPDHYRYRRQDLEEMCREAQGAAGMITTAKDAVKLTHWVPPIPVWILDIEFQFRTGEKALKSALQKVLAKYTAEESR